MLDNLRTNHAVVVARILGHVISDCFSKISAKGSFLIRKKKNNSTLSLLLDKEGKKGRGEKKITEKTETA